MRTFVLLAAAVLLAAPAGARMASLDASFGTGGIVVLPLGAHVAHCYAVAQQPDGALVLAGGSDIEYPSFDQEYDATLVRLLPDGRLDARFGEGGVVVRRTGRRHFETVFHAVLVTPDGRIVAAGSEYDAGRPSPKCGSACTSRAVVARFDRDGNPDPTFGEGGIRVVDLGAHDFVLNLVLRSDGASVLADALFDFARLDYDVALVRHDAAGRPDESFGDGGRTVLDLGYSDYAARVTALPGDRLLVVAGGPGVALARLDTGGHLDPTFGRGGITRTLPDGDTAVAVAVDARGRLLVATVEVRDFEFISRLHRFRSDGHLLGGPRGGGDVVLPTDVRHLLPQADGTIVGVTLDAGPVWIATRIRAPWGG